MGSSQAESFFYKKKKEENLTPLSPRVVHAPPRAPPPLAAGDLPGPLHHLLPAPPPPRRVPAPPRGASPAQGRRARVRARVRVVGAGRDGAIGGGGGGGAPGGGSGARVPGGGAAGRAAAPLRRAARRRQVPQRRRRRRERRGLARRAPRRAGIDGNGTPFLSHICSSDHTDFSLCLRDWLSFSPHEIDFMLQSSLHCKVPNGAIDITSLLIFLNASTDAPHFLMEFIQGSPTSIVVLLDLLPRKDLALHPEYIERYYENTQVDKQREKVEELPQAPILMSIDCGQGGEGTLEEIVRGQLATAARALLQIWLDSCADHTSEMEEGERENMIKRDQIVRSKSIEVDLTSNLPRMFGPDVADRVIAEIQKAFGVQ
nr:Red chlorophyll catabolite reductase [Oryza sativa Japonica Group]